ncbi:MAG TPA: DUF2845 domain-containing protein [Steroidobacteraceae bacterium]|nr:DUF2845 domain-containing protein [Steroidobacteraceae bacterium]
MRSVIAMCVLLVMVPSTCFSDGFFRCGSSLVSAEVSVGDLLKKCGKPTSQTTSIADVRNEYGYKVGTSKTEVWRYDRGSRAAAMIVTIVDGQVQNIESGK